MWRLLFLQACNVIEKETPSQVFSCQFCEIFKNIFFIEHLRGLRLPTLKPLDSQRQLCKWISKLVTVYFISVFLVLGGIFMFIFGEHKLSFYISIALWLRRYDISDFSHDLTIKVSCDFFGRSPLILIQHPTKFWCLWTLWMWTKRFWFVTLPRDWCATWLCGWVPSS